MRRVGAWATARSSGLRPDLAEEVTAETCAEVWRTLTLSRGGAAFEGFVQGRFVEALRRALGDGESSPVAAEQVAARLDELRARNPRHARAIELHYLDRATPAEAADLLTVDIWELRSMIARARLVLARGPARPARSGRPDDGRRPAARSGRSRRPGRG